MKSTEVDEAARDAARYVGRDPADTERAERKRPNHPLVSVDQLIAKGRTVADRMRPIVERIVDGVRSRIGRKHR